MRDKKTNALLVIAAAPHIRAFLKVWDPQALKQVEKALGKLKPTRKTHPQTFDDAKILQMRQEVLRRKSKMGA